LSDPPPRRRRTWGIETARCPSCTECQSINDKMFTYNENKQVYIVDVKLGTFRQMVEASEACQVAIIHPGKLSNPNEAARGDSARRRNGARLASPLREIGVS
jgi:ferredoxin